MYLKPFIVLSVVLAACNATPDLSGNNSLATGSSVSIPVGNYDSASYALLKGVIKAKSKVLTTQAPGNVRRFLFSVITDSLFSYWYGTPWDYNGITEVPRQGKIACGYFVTTIIRDAGLPVARIKMAQAPASTLINTVCATGSIRRFSGIAALTTYLDARPAQSLFILGLDNHVGFVMKDSTGIYFVHASYVGAGAVEKQLLSEAGPVQASGSFMIGDLLANERLLGQWFR